MSQTLEYQPIRTSPAGIVWPVYVTEGLTTVGSSLLMVGVFFYTTHHFGWNARQNLLLAMAQGAAYAVGALAAGPLCKKLGNANALIVAHAAIIVLTLVGLLPLSGFGAAVLLTAYVLVSATTWPAMEGLICRGGIDAHRISRRVGIYNLVWSGIGALVVAAAGTIIAYWEPGVFVFSAISSVLSIALMAASRRHLPREEGSSAAPAHAAPEPQLLRVRRVALWLARISLPATFVAVYSMMALMPSLPIIRPLDTTQQTLVCSTWLVARWLAFLLIGMTAWWHTRPRLLLGAAALLIVTYVGVTLRPSDLTSAVHFSAHAELTMMIGWQIVMGACLGIIYSGSLYFGMVLSEGSTEHGGFHEALIGVGQVIGPGSGAVAQTLWPGDDKKAVAAVCAVLCATVIVAAFASIRVGSQSD